MINPILRATPFHARAAEANRNNAWITRNGTTLAERYDDLEQEILAARSNVAIADISWRWRVMFEGAAAESFVSRLVTKNAAALAPGAAFKALWLSDAGGVRGAAVIARFGRDSFQLAATASDAEWIEAAASSFSVSCRDVSGETGGIAVVGPYAQSTLVAAGIPTDLAPLSFRKISWRGLSIMASCWGEHGGYEIWCAPDDGVLVWDRLMHAGAEFGILPAGVSAFDVLDLEAGIARPGLDYAPARDSEAADPHPVALGLQSLVESEHGGFNGRKAYLAGIANTERALVGLEINAEEPAPFTPVIWGDKPVGHTLRSAYSPTLRRAIALASLDLSAAPGTVVSVTLPPSFAVPELRKAGARVATLPFLPEPRPDRGRRT